MNTTDQSHEIDSSDASSPRTALGSFGLTSAVCLVVANMLGAGVFTTSGFSLASLEDREIVMWAWLIGGAIAICGALSYGQLARKLTESGGEYLYLSRMVHPSVGFIAGWVSLLAGFTGAIAFAATVFESYALPESVRPEWYVDGTAGIASILVFGLLHSSLLRSGLVTQNLIVALKLLLLLGFIGFAFFVLPGGTWAGLNVDRPHNSFSIYGFAAALVWISLSYSGFNAAVYVSGEVRNPRRNVPLALFVGTVIVTVLYFALNFIFIYSASPEAVSGQADVAAVAAQSIGGSFLETLVRIIISLALLSSVSSMIVAGPRVYEKMASDGVFPAIFGLTEDKRLRSPAAAIWLQVILASVVVYFTTLKNLLDYLGFTLSVSAALTVACVFWINRKQPFTIWRLAGWLIASVYVVSTLTIAILSLQVQEKPQMLYVFFGITASGLLLYYVTQWWRAKT